MAAAPAKSAALLAIEDPMYGVVVPVSATVIEAGIASIPASVLQVADHVIAEFTKRENPRAESKNGNPKLKPDEAIKLRWMVGAGIVSILEAKYSVDDRKDKEQSIGELLLQPIPSSRDWQPDLRYWYRKWIQYNTCKHGLIMSYSPLVSELGIKIAYRIAELAVVLPSDYDTVTKNHS